MSKQIVKETEEILVTQADRIIKKFGGVLKLGIALKNVGCGRSISTIHKWTYPREKGGTGGQIPTAILFDILQAAKLAKVKLTDEDLDFRPRVEILIRKIIK